MSWEIVVLYALVLGLLGKTNLIEERVKKLREDGEQESKRRIDRADRH